MSFHKSITDKWEYIPIFVFGLLFISDEKLDTHFVSNIIKIGISFVLFVLLYYLICHHGYNKYCCFFTASVLWITFIFLKRCKIEKVLFQG